MREMHKISIQVSEHRYIQTNGDFDETSIRYRADTMNEEDVEKCSMDGSRMNTNFHGSHFEMTEIDKLRRIVVLSHLLTATLSQMTKTLNMFWTNIAMMNVKYFLGFFQYYHKFHTSFCYAVAVYVQVFLSTNPTSFGSKCRKRAESVRVNGFLKSFCHIALLTFIIKNRVMLCSTSLLVVKNGRGFGSNNKDTLMNRCIVFPLTI
ncbi:hypothetical protein TSAR_014932 [Trichomalopsis sarcophagae]|uniref:Uncharacterized protein n=1 Tax=Trichomalopsis sarcophagae TaxID=543379 RepID=A0A232FLH7_9HYME|nr:hypothetical protein TSAR_014932 [Trichomalopsis sarcophagae]